MSMFDVLFAILKKWIESGAEKAHNIVTEE